MLTIFEGQVRDLVKDCVILSHYHAGINYHTAFELSPFEKQIVGEFVSEEHEREMKLRSMSMGKI